MLAAVFALVLATAYAAEIPSYINVCGKDPNLDQCIMDNINNLRNKFCEGLVDLNLPKVEPFNIKKLVISDTANSKIYLNDVQISGLCNFIINSFHADLDTPKFNIDVLFKRLYLNATYDIDIHILVPIVYRTPLYIFADDIRVNGSLQAESVIKDGKKYMYVKEVKLNIDIKEYEVLYDFKDNKIDQLEQILGDLISNNQEEFIQRLVPSLEKDLSKWLIPIFNGLFKKFTFDELFPDRT